MNNKNTNLWIAELLMLCFLLLMMFRFDIFSEILEPVIGIKKNTVEWLPLHELVFQHMTIVIASSAASFLIAFTTGVLVHIYHLEGVKELLITVAAFGTTFPTIAVMALLVSDLGYGFKPVFFALALYGLLPILMSTIRGLEDIDEDIITAAKGVGMTAYERLIRVELPQSKSVIIAGVRTSVIINIAAATVGGVVGAGGLGIPIVTGIRVNDPVLILEGALPVALMALLADRIFYKLEGKQKWRIR